MLIDSSDLSITFKQQKNELGNNYNNHRFAWWMGGH